MKVDNTKFNYYFNLIKNSPHFLALRDEVIKEMLENFHVETWRKGGIPFNNQGSKNNLYLIISGRVKVYQINVNNGNEYIVEILDSGNLFDIICLLDGQEHQVSTEALDDVGALVAPMYLVRQWITKHPEFNQTLLPYLGKQLRFFEESATDLALLNTWSRTIKLFVNHININLHSSQLKLINNLSHTELASMIGSARNVLNRHLQKLKEKDIIQIDRNHINIKDTKALIEQFKNW
ncbi:MAG: Crp/Fnr family transcriptional regulator [Flavobacteriaceae bacterium]|nr:Crp/Fnr family transcriptional regulator [Flavobacteriaceae bacterium]